MMMRDIAAALSSPLIGDDAIDILGLADPADKTKASDLALAMSGEAVAALANCNARAVIVADGCHAPLDRFDAVITVKRPRVALAILTKLFARPASLGAGIHASAVIAPNAEVSAGARVGAFSVIGPNTRIGDGATIHAHVTVGADVTI